MNENIVRVEIYGLISAAVPDILHNPAENIVICLNLALGLQVIVNELFDFSKLFLRNVRFARCQCSCRLHGLQ